MLQDPLPSPGPNASEVLQKTKPVHCVSHFTSNTPELRLWTSLHLYPLPYHVAFIPAILGDPEFCIAKWTLSLWCMWAVLCVAKLLPGTCKPTQGQISVGWSCIATFACLGCASAALGDVVQPFTCALHACSYWSRNEQLFWDRSGFIKRIGTCTWAEKSRQKQW